LPTNKNLVDLFLNDFDAFFYRFLAMISDFDEEKMNVDDSQPNEGKWA
jgi:hypothetical protein